MRLSGGCVGLIVMMIGNVRAARGVVVISGLCAVSGTGMQQRVGIGFVPSLTRLTRRRPRGRSLGAAAALASGQHDGDDDGELRHAAAPFVYAAHDMARFQEEYRTRGWVEIADFVPGSIPSQRLMQMNEDADEHTPWLARPLMQQDPATMIVAPVSPRLPPFVSSDRAHHVLCCRRHAGSYACGGDRAAPERHGLPLKGVAHRLSGSRG